MRGEENTM